MKYTPQKGDEIITTLRITKRIRRKLGMVLDKNILLAPGLEAILDKELKKK